MADLVYSEARFNDLLGRINNNINKLKYLYYEWFGEIESNKEIITKRMFKDIKEELKKTHYDIYNIIKLSYNSI